MFFKNIYFSKFHYVLPWWINEEKREKEIWQNVAIREKIGFISIVETDRTLIRKRFHECKR